MPIVPDDKNWTWVLERPCADCGFVASTFDCADAPTVIIANANERRGLLDHPKAGVRPNDDQWSALEYGCHVRDVFRIFLRRLELMLTEDGPQFENWDQDATASTDRYSTQDPRTVADEIESAASALAASLAAVAPGDLQRMGFRSDGAALTIESFTRYLMHDPIHHVWDVARGYAQIG